MQQGRGGMGSHKHGTSGHSGPSPRFKHARALEDNRDKPKRRKAKLTYKSASDAVKGKGK